LRGGIRDAQSRYNLRNLVDANHKIVAGELAALKRLCESAAVAPEAADQIASGPQRAWQPDKGSESGKAVDTPLAPRSVEQLVWLGLDADSAGRLLRFVDLLPEATPLNLNTAAPEVLAGVVPGLDASSAERIVQRRPFKTLQEARAYIPEESALDGKRLDVASRYFEISGRLRMEGRALEERLLVLRRNREVVPLSRNRQSVLLGPS
jgi:general secretion pathway protein K